MAKETNPDNLLAEVLADFERKQQKAREQLGQFTAEDYDNLMAEDVFRLVDEDDPLFRMTIHGWQVVILSLVLGFSVGWAISTWWLK